MHKIERQAKILEIIKKKGFVTYEMLANHFGISIASIRRDLKVLSGQNLARLEYGGVTKINYLHGGDEPIYETKVYINHKQKQGIANFSVGLIKQGETIILDSGTTNAALACAIRKANFSKLTVITSDLISAMELCPDSNIRVILLGGILRTAYFYTYGTYAETILGTLSVNKCFLGGDGVSIKRGVSNTVLEEVSVKQKMIEISDKVILLAASSKFGYEASYKVCNLGAVNLIISDSDMPSEQKKLIEEIGISYKLVNF